MAVGGIQGAQQNLALSGLRGVNAQTRAFGEGISQTLSAAEQTAQQSSGGGSSLATGAEVPSDTTRVSPTASGDPSRGTNLDILA